MSLCHSSLCPLELQFFQLYKRKRTNERSGVQSLVFNGSSLLPSFRFSSFISIGKWGTMKEDRRDGRTDDLLLLSFHNSTKHLFLFFPLSPFLPHNPAFFPRFALKASPTSPSDSRPLSRGSKSRVETHCRDGV